MEPIKSNLEPIEEGDMNLREKLKKEDVGGLGFDGEDGGFKIEKEAAKESIVAEKDASYAQIMSKLGDDSSGSGSDDDVSSDAKDVSLKTDAESQISNLVDIAMVKGVVHAVKVAKHIEDNYVLDAFHDKLMAQELHDALVQKGLLKNI